MQKIHRYSEYRGCLLADGSCYNNANQLLGFVNVKDATAGDADEAYLGKAVVQVMLVDRSFKGEPQTLHM